MLLAVLSHPDLAVTRHKNSNRLSLLLADTDSSTSSSGSLRVLTSHSETPVVTETTVRSDLLQSLQILTELALHVIGQNLAVLAIDDISLSVEEPGWNFVLCRVLDDRDDSLEFFRCDLTSTVDTISLSPSLLGVLSLRTACLGRHRPSCTPSWSIFVRHP